MRKSISALAVAVVLITGCGNDQQAASELPSVDVAASTLPTTSPATAPVPATMTQTSECEQDRKTLEVGVEAYYAQNGSYPDSTAELAGEYTRADLTSYTLGPDGSIERVPGAPCVIPSSEGSATSQPPRTADEFYAMLSEDDIAGFGGPECAIEVAVVLVASQLFIDREWREPVSLDELADDLERPITLWAFDADRRTLIPAAGSPCVDYWGELDTQQETCDGQFMTLITANEAYYAMNGSYPNSQQDLLEQQMIREQIDGFTVAGGSVVPDVGSACDAIVAVPASIVARPEDCAQDRRSLEVAVEAYQARFGSLPDNEQVLIDAGMIRTGFATYDVVYGEIVPGDRSPCL